MNIKTNTVHSHARQTVSPCENHQEEMSTSHCTTVSNDDQDQESFSNLAAQHPQGVRINRSRSAGNLDDELIHAATAAIDADEAERRVHRAEPESIDVQLFECHRALMSVRESVDAKHRKLEERFKSALAELDDCRRRLQEKDARIQELIDERDDAKDELAREQSGESSLMRGISRENAKMIRRMREMRSESQMLRKENEILRRQLGCHQSSTVANNSFEENQHKEQMKEHRFQGGQKEHQQGEGYQENLNKDRDSRPSVRPAMQRRLSGEKRPNWFLGLGQGGHHGAEESNYQEHNTENESQGRATKQRITRSSGRFGMRKGKNTTIKDGSPESEDSLRSSFASQASLSMSFWEAVEGLSDETSVCSGSVVSGKMSAHPKDFPCALGAKRC
eukprot:CAMPEP_0197452064 /NCGR_PEP_ID=MMETSP1175-20131217/30989_1 /TAXON_ID=1003142 /ORGANISM="Triceratium dubium, Strain CCMP147" /LENGTH=391 /DNA_ID=CAMNT_0042984967 /DNA_START=71 /DNA_END=1246 /DNA_ORIENTATION=+